ncbi:hypothetical protein GLOTRDRAFT_132139 [Gloeophyllum trabeum ATCC 11539]|uniref:Uncharacterized protein n=1 Tax=Gloeophyllum trabeum (strain ATCC 11539 / FP-39264 / Madison 617) TaxID=670483 RepID=S7RHG3_GLOTA|nr:uncharacterized protein GLOTRDRAFT_132139 [Gloeophyllum trabeum ATCC 11539]EPQ52014.1 hypothetical protein GLOTRDRAFT_132139 [Gloeophyllum trabeum ATCC 11539]
MSDPSLNSMQGKDCQSRRDRKYYLGILGLNENQEAIFKEKILTLAKVYLDMDKPVSRQRIGSYIWKSVSSSWNREA